MEVVQLQKKRSLRFQSWMNDHCIASQSLLRVVTDYGPETGTGRRYTDWMVVVHNWAIMAKSLSSWVKYVSPDVLSMQNTLELREKTFSHLREKHAVTCFGSFGWDRTGHHRILRATAVLASPLHCDIFAEMCSIFELYEALQPQHISVEIEP